MAPLNYRERAGAIEGQKVKLFLTFKSQNLGKNYKKYIENQCFSVQLVKKIITFAISWTIYFNF